MKILRKEFCDQINYIFLVNHRHIILRDPYDTMAFKLLNREHFKILMYVFNVCKTDQKQIKEELV